MKTQGVWLATISMTATVFANACATLGRHETPAIESIQELKTEVMGTQSNELVVSTQLLKSLLSQERLAQRQCKDLHGKLEAIKNIDLEGAPL